MVWFWFLIVALMLFLPFALAVVCLSIAKEKERNTLGWFLCGFFFGFIALWVVSGLEKLPSKEEK